MTEPLRDEGSTGITIDAAGYPNFPPPPGLHMHEVPDPARPGWMIAMPCIIDHEEQTVSDDPIVDVEPVQPVKEDPPPEPPDGQDDPVPLDQR